LELSASTQSEAEVSEAALRQAALGYLRRWQADPEVGRSAMAVVMAGEWLKNLARLERDVDSAVITLSESARKPWWR
jgi:hypothetical protein